MRAMKPAVRGTAFQSLEPQKELLAPCQTANSDKNKGWAYCMRSAQQDAFLLYFEQGCARAMLSGLLPGAQYPLRWFKLTTGEWIAGGTLQADGTGKFLLPLFPDGASTSTTDWGGELSLSEVPPVRELLANNAIR